MDEHRIGLKPVIRRVWASPGYRPTTIVHHRYQWLYVYGFVQPTTGQNFWLLLPTVSIAAFNLALQEFAAFVHPAPDKVVRLLVDRAGWHTSPNVIEPAGMRLLFQPAYSPELQPAEHLWQLSDQPLLNHYFATLDDLELVQAERCAWLIHHPEVVKSATNFHWWPQVA